MKSLLLFVAISLSNVSYADQIFTEQWVNKSPGGSCDAGLASFQTEMDKRFPIKIFGVRGYFLEKEQSCQITFSYYSDRMVRTFEKDIPVESNWCLDYASVALDRIRIADGLIPLAAGCHGNHFKFWSMQSEWSPPALKETGIIARIWIDENRLKNFIVAEGGTNILTFRGPQYVSLIYQVPGDQTGITIFESRILPRTFFGSVPGGVDPQSLSACKAEAALVTAALIDSRPAGLGTGCVPSYYPSSEITYYHLEARSLVGGKYGYTDKLKPGWWADEVKTDFDWRECQQNRAAIKEGYERTKGVKVSHILCTMDQYRGAVYTLLGQQGEK
ncbi:MAG: hypothetical protein AB7F86_04795 [Bdellovibrionales bacterium]